MSTWMELATVHKQKPLQDELENHSKPGSLSVFVYYGGDRINDLKVISEHDVVLTTYGVLASAYKSVCIIIVLLFQLFFVQSLSFSFMSINEKPYPLSNQDPEKISIFHEIDWYRVVLDEAHSIKSSKTVVAQSAYALNAYSRWCLTGTPLQVSKYFIFFPRLLRIIFLGFRFDCPEGLEYVLSFATWSAKLHQSTKL